MIIAVEGFITAKVNSCFLRAFISFLIHKDVFIFPQIVLNVKMLK